MVELHNKTAEPFDEITSLRVGNSQWSSSQAIHLVVKDGAVLIQIDLLEGK